MPTKARKYGKSKSHTFSQVPKAEIPRSSFDRTSTLKTTFDAGYIIPIFLDEVLPGDTFNMRASFFGRLATPIKPLMDNLYLETFWFFVPNRLVWDNWEKFNGAQDNPGDDTDFSIPTVGSAGVTYSGVGSLWDYFGLPTGQTPDNFNVSALPYRGFSLIYNEWFRDQNLQESQGVPVGDGPDALHSDTSFSGRVQALPLRRGKRHDYFTSALPWPQKGDPVTVPLGAQAPLRTDAQSNGLSSLGIGATATSENPATLNSSGTDLTVSSGAPDFEIYADLSKATGFTINQLRQSFQIQRLLERDARGGTRYTEVIKSHFGVTSPDARLQRPEFLGGSSEMISVSPVPQQSPSNISPDLTPQGNLAGMGVVAGQSGFTKSFTEHGYVFGFANVRADLTYQQGINRLWSRQTRYDFYWPALSHLGEQAILNKEIYADGTSADDDVFGYQEAYGEYRYRPSQITGKFRSSDAASLDVWHLAQDFADLPVLGPAFIEDNPPVDRVIAVQDEPHMLLDAYFKLRTVRPMPLYGVPGLIDHF